MSVHPLPSHSTTFEAMSWKGFTKGVVRVSIKEIPGVAPHAAAAVSHELLLIGPLHLLTDAR